MSPDGVRRVPPEEKLLRLIRGKRVAASSTSQAAEANHAAPSLTKRSLVWWGWSTASWWMPVINVGLGVLLVVELIAVWRVITRPDATPLSVTQVLPPSAPLPKAAESPEPAAPASASSLASLATRPLFTGVEAGSQPAHANRKTSQEASAMAGRLSLIGVVEGTPSQAIIEDAETKKTYFVSAGQSVVEGVMVESVSERQVVLDLNGEKITLSL